MIFAFTTSNYSIVILKYMRTCRTHVFLSVVVVIMSLLPLFNILINTNTYISTLEEPKSTTKPDENETALVPPAQKILNSTCYRFSHVLTSAGAGMGHKFGEVIMGMMLAQKTNSTFVYDSETWSFKGFHGGYEWFNEFLPLEETAVTLTDLQISNMSLMKVDDNFLHLIARSKGEFKDSCNLIFISSYSRCDGSCFQSSHTGSYNEVKWRLREVLSNSKFQPSIKIFENYTRQDILSVAWHLRGGDIVLHSSEEFYKILASELVSVLQDFSYHIFFLESLPKISISFPNFVIQSFLTIAVFTTTYPMLILSITLWLLTFW